jgi:hypothetical protein
LAYIYKKEKLFFLKETFSEKEYERLVKENANPEYWINLLTIDEFFSETPNWGKKSSVLARALVSIWTVKLANDFSDIDFTVEYLCNKETGAYGLTFYQTNKYNIKKPKKMDKEISTPNIKESKIEQSLYGPRAGMPKFRKPRADEMPKSK